MPYLSSSRQTHLDAIIQIGELADFPDDGAELVREYFRNVPCELLLAHSAEKSHELIQSHISMARLRRVSEDCVSVSVQEHLNEQFTSIDIVTDDKPYLIESLTNALSARSLQLREIVHPQFWVKRSHEGQILRLSGPESRETCTDAVMESWIHLEVSGVLDHSALDSLKQHLQHVLHDVRVVVEDEAEMKSRALELGASLQQGVTGLDKEEIADGCQLLDWIADGNSFTLMGYRAYTLGYAPDGSGSNALTLQAVEGTGLGLLRATGSTPEYILPPVSASQAEHPELAVITNTNARSTVRTTRKMDYIGIKRLDEEVRVVGEQRFLGLFTDERLVDFDRVSYLRRKTQLVVKGSGFTVGSHLSNQLLRTLQELPRQEIVQSSAARLTDLAVNLVQLNQRPRTRAFFRRDTYGRFVSVLVMLPQSWFHADLVPYIENLLMEALNGQDAETVTRITDGRLAQIYVVVHFEGQASTRDIDETRLELEIDRLTRPWEDALHIEVNSAFDPFTAQRLLNTHLERFNHTYRSVTSPKDAAADLAIIDSVVQGLGAQIRFDESRTQEANLHEIRIAVNHQLSITHMLRMLQDMGLEPISERSFDLQSDNRLYFHVIGFTETSAMVKDENWKGRIVDCLQALLNGSLESDPLNSLVTFTRMSWRQVVLLRALAAYLSQTRSNYSRGYIQEALYANPECAEALYAYFEARFLPQDDTEQTLLESGANDLLDEMLDGVVSRDHDRILHDLRTIIAAVVRTNAYQRIPTVAAVTFKLAPKKLIWLPQPIPSHELFVYSSRVEGVHLRFGEVARGGLRWSDRKEDYRTEVLSLAKAQAVKNSIIVPAGAKGGFIAKQLPDPTLDRMAWIEAGKSAYREFIAGMLSVTDNLIDGQIIPPSLTVRHDEDDPYLVVAADKGTAAFSDTANAVATEYGFWLGDAFASGGSVGYDHKAMGITARGAWESVRRHFRELGIDPQTQDFTAVGIGDMSGDVFGNGMLLSRHTQLVAAFDHRDIFIDPSPDASASFEERQRLFKLPRSSWSDYNPEIISKGGGVFPRNAKSITLSLEARKALGLSEETVELSPNDVISAILCAPVDLLWNGGVGTYVKASWQSNSDIGDRSNDSVRVDGAKLRCRIVGEGGNLGFSQQARIEAAEAGVRINTDAIDNSAGVDSSDYEVNIKILLDAALKSGRLTQMDRAHLLLSMTDDVAAFVLRHNYEQNVLLSNARSQQHHMLGAHQRFMRWLEEEGQLDRPLEALPDDAELERRAAEGLGLTSPEFAVLVAYAKISLEKSLLASTLPDDPWFERELVQYFPSVLEDRFPEELRSHPLRREIIANRVANQVVDRAGITFLFRAMEDTGASAEQIVRAFIASREIFGLRAYTDAVEALDGKVSTSTQTSMYLGIRRLLARSVRWFMQHQPEIKDMDKVISRYSHDVRELSTAVFHLLRGEESTATQCQAETLVRAGVPEDLALRASALVFEHELLHVVHLAKDVNLSPQSILGIRFELVPLLGMDKLSKFISDLPRETRWDSLARNALRQEVQSLLDAITAQVIAEADPGTPEKHVNVWATRRGQALEQVKNTIADLLSEESLSTSPILAVVQMIHLVADRPCKEKVQTEPSSTVKL